MLRLVALALLLASGPTLAEEAPRAVLLVAPEVPPAAAQALEQRVVARHAPIERVQPASPPEPAAEQVLAEVRPLYAAMSFRAATAKLTAAEESIIAGRLPSPPLVKALAEVELWMGALLQLEHDAAGAAERFQLAARLAPSARPDRIFPPEVATAFAQARTQPARVPVAVQVAPVGARLWLDGRLVTPPVAAAPGVHYVVVERADKRRVTKLVRLPRAAPEIAVSLGEPADAPTALLGADERLKVAPLGRDEGLGVSAILGKPLWSLRLEGPELVLARFAATDATRPTADVREPRDRASALGDDLCNLEPGCAAPPAPIVVAPPPPPPRPYYKRGWFWGVVAGGAAIAGGIIAVSVIVTQPRNYDVVLR
jgi:hypothetical protein